MLRAMTSGPVVPDPVHDPEHTGPAGAAAATALAPLPAGTCLLHVGPPKTGTTALQGAFWNDRAALSAKGVRYAGGARQPQKAMMAATGRAANGRSRPPSRRLWDAVVREVRSCPEPRSVISSEGFAYATEEAARAVVADLGPDRVHVLLTLRPFAAMLASEWQQSVQMGMGLDFDAWLHRLFEAPGTWPAKGFWERRHDRVVTRWAAAAGADRVTVLVVDERDRDAHFRALERLLELPEGALVPDVDRANRSLTLEETEVLRALRADFKADGLPVADYIGLVATRATLHMKRRTPGPLEHRIEVPAWALERAAGVAREITDVVRASGVRVIGDLEHLASVPAPGRREAPAVTTVPLEVAASAAMGLVLASGSAGGSKAVGGPWARWRLAEDLSLSNLAALLGMGIAIRLRRLVRRGGGRGAGRSGD